MKKSTALITGTTSGIGKAICEELAKMKINLVLVSRNATLLEEQKRHLMKKYEITVDIYAADLCDESTYQKIFDYTNSKDLIIDILVNNAGFNECGIFTETELSKEVDMLKVHTIALTSLTKHYIDSMVKNGKGYILNVGSTGSYAPFPNDAVYAASKAYVYNFSRALRSELKKTGVSVTTLTPGATQSEFAEKAGIEKTRLFNTFVQPAEKVAKDAIKALFNKKYVVTSGVFNKLLIASMKITPYFILDKISPAFFKNVN